MGRPPAAKLREDCERLRLWERPDPKVGGVRRPRVGQVSLVVDGAELGPPAGGVVGLLTHPVELHAIVAARLVVDPRQRGVDLASSSLQLDHECHVA